MAIPRIRQWIDALTGTRRALGVAIPRTLTAPTLRSRAAAGWQSRAARGEGLVEERVAIPRGQSQARQEKSMAGELGAAGIGRALGRRWLTLGKRVAKLTTGCCRPPCAVGNAAVVVSPQARHAPESPALAAGLFRSSRHKKGSSVSSLSRQGGEVRDYLSGPSFSLRLLYPLTTWILGGTGGWDGRSSSPPLIFSILACG